MQINAAQFKLLFTILYLLGATTSAMALPTIPANQLPGWEIITKAQLKSDISFLASHAERHGAIAILIAPEPNRKHPSNLERQQRISNIVNHQKSLPSMVRIFSN